jgi:hypothetical protein
MTQPPYTPTGGRPMRRFAIFATVLFALVVIGSQPRTVSAHGHSMCVCMATRAELILKSMTNSTATAKAKAPAQPHLTETALAAE